MNLEINLTANQIKGKNYLELSNEYVITNINSIIQEWLQHNLVNDAKQKYLEDNTQNILDNL